MPFWLISYNAVSKQQSFYANPYECRSCGGHQASRFVKSSSCRIWYRVGRRGGRIFFLVVVNKILE